MTRNFGKVITAMVTPFNQKDEISEDSVIKLVQHLIETGNDGIVVSGTTGESPTLTKEEKINLFNLVKKTAGNRAKVIANVGNNNTKESAEFAKLVEEKTDVDGLLVVNPYYNKPNQRGLYAHFKTVAENTSLPIMLYNIPGRTSVNLESEMTIELSKIKNVVAIKESSGNLEQMSKIIKNTDKDFKVYSGDDHLTLPLISMGGQGVVSVAGHFFASEIKEMIETKNSDIHHKLLPFFQSLFSDTNPVPTKHLLNELGFDVGGVRLPLVGIEREIGKEVLHSYQKTKKTLGEAE